MPVQIRYYESDLTDRQWKIIKPLLPKAKSGPGKRGRPESDLRRAHPKFLTKEYSLF
jgi:transposase